jgi:hypothetical protein
MMNGKDLHSRRTRPTPLDHKFGTPNVKELPSDVGYSEREPRQETSNQSDATLLGTSPEDRRFAPSDAPPDGS